MARKIAVLTGGGDCPGLNPVIRSVVETCHNLYQVPVLGLLDGFEGTATLIHALAHPRLYTGRYEVLTNTATSDIVSLGGTILGTTNRGHFGLPLNPAVLDKAVETYKALGLTCVVMIGGDGTMSIGHQLAQRGVNFVGVPKTIDNDLQSTDQTFGFDSAVSVVTECIDRLHSTAASHHRVMVVEVMGRNAGWIALQAGVAGGASVILLPEIEWTWEHVISRIRRRVEMHRYHYCIVVVSEGVRLPDATAQTFRSQHDATRPEQRLGGVGALVAQRIGALSGYETREVVLGHIQRGGSPTCFDRVLATKFGTYAAKLACEGDYGKMVALKGTRIEAVPITGDMRKQRVVEPDSDQLVWAARAIGVSFGDRTCEVDEASC